MLNLNDVSPPLKGKWKLDVYEGDVRRAVIDVRKQRVNEALLRQGKLPKYIGEILNRKPVEVIEGENLIVTVGKQMIMDRLYGLSAVGAMSRTGVGTSATAAALTDTGLTGGVFLAFDSAATRSSLTVTSITTFGTAQANINWQELALDNGTTILNRIAPIGPFNKTSAVSIVVTVAVTQT